MRVRKTQWLRLQRLRRPQRRIDVDSWLGPRWLRRNDGATRLCREGEVQQVGWPAPRRLECARCTLFLRAPAVVFLRL